MCSTTLYPFDRLQDQRKGQIGICEETGIEIFGGLVAILGQGGECATIHTWSLVGVISMRKPRKATLGSNSPLPLRSIVYRMHQQSSGPPKDVYMLIPGSSEHVTIHGKQNFASVIKDLEMGKLFWIIHVTPV